MNNKRGGHAANPKTGTTGVSEEELNAFVDGELDPARREEVAALVEQNTELQKQVAEIKQLNDQLKAYGEEGSSDNLPPRIRALVDTWLKRT